MKSKSFITLILVFFVSILCPAQDNSYDRVAHAHFTLEDSIPSMNFDEFLSRNVEWIDNGADAQTICTIEFDVVGNGEIENISVTSLGHVDFVEKAVLKAVLKGAQYWVLDPSALGNRERMQFKYKWVIQ